MNDNRISESQTGSARRGGPTLPLSRYLRRLVWLSMLPVLLLATGFAADVVRRLYAADDQEAQQLAARVADDAGDLLQDRILALQLLADSPLLDQPGLGDFHRRAQSYRKLFGSEVIVADSQGQMLAHTGRPWGTPLPPLPRPAGRAAGPTTIATGRPAVGDPFVGPVSDKPMVAVAVPVLRSGGSARALLTPIELRQFQPLIDKAGVPPGWRAALLDGQGRVIAGSRLPASAAGAKPHVVPVAVAGWSVVVEPAASVLLGPVLAASVALALLLAGAAAAGHLTGRRGGRGLTDAVSSLVQHPAPSARGATIDEIEAVRAALERSRVRLTAFVQQAPLSMALFDREMNYLATSSSWLRDYGQGLSSLVGANHYTLFPDLPAQWREVHQRALAGETQRNEADHWQRANGDEHWMRWVVQPWTDETGAIAGLIIASEEITERVLSERSVREMAARLEAVFRTVPVGIAISCLPGGQVVDVNPALEALLGWQRDELVGRTEAELQVWERPQERDAMLQALATHGAVHAIEARYRRKSGEAIDVLFSACRVEIGGQPHLVGMALDITLQKQARMALERHRDELEAEVAQRTADLEAAYAEAQNAARLNRAITDHMPGRISYWDADLRCRFASQVFLDWIGKPTSEVLGRPMAELFEAAHLDQVLPHARAALKGETPRFQFTTRRQGEEFVDQGTYVPDQVGEEPVRGFYALALDITALERTKEELRQANAALAQRAETIADLYDRAPCGYFSLDPRRTVIEINQTALSLLGFGRDEVIGRRITEFMTEQSQALQLERFAEFVRTGKARDLAYDFLCKDGRVLPVLVSSDLIRDAGGTFVSTRSTFVDNTDRRAHEREVAAMQVELARRADEAEAANRAKSAFLANMSHEIRTPMNAIIGLTHLISRDLGDPLQRSRLDKVSHAAKHLLQVLNDILDLSKIDAGKLVLEDVEFSLDLLVGRAFEMVGEAAREKQLELVLDTDHLPDRLRGDPTRLSQALINLLSNAVKFTERGWVDLRGKVVREERGRLLIRFEVQDTGAGIAPDRQAQIFDAFEQAENSTTRRYGGTGLGLSLTRHLARMMGGEVGLTSAPGAGSTFWFTAWLGRGEAAGDAGQGRSLAGRRALLVDDLPEALAALGERLRSLGLQVDALADGETAIRKVASEASAARHYDMILIDWRMEPLDGIRTLEGLRNLPAAPLPPTVLVTALDDPTMWQRARAAGFDAILVKPITASVLHDTLVRIVRNNGEAEVISTTPAPLAIEVEALLRDRHHGLRVLLAEDNAVNREIACELLQRAALRVDTAIDGLEAVERVLARPYDLVLMDMQMPNLDGLGATRAIRARLGSKIPIVAMTANAFGEDRAACLAAGMDDHLAKPVDPDQLFATLLRWLPKADVSVAGKPPTAEPSEAADAGLLRDRLALVDGLDVVRALRNVGGQVPALERVLQRFVDTYGAGVPELLSAESEDDLDRWRGTAHALLGACSAIGATDLLRAVEAFDRSLRSPAASLTLAAEATQLHEGLVDLCARVKAELAV